MSNVLLISMGNFGGDDVHEKKDTKHAWPTGNAYH
jgi:hypothetical protein